MVTCSVGSRRARRDWCLGILTRSTQTLCCLVTRECQNFVSRPTPGYPPHPPHSHPTQGAPLIPTWSSLSRAAPSPPSRSPSPAAPTPSSHPTTFSAHPQTLHPRISTPPPAPPSLVPSSTPTCVPPRPRGSTRPTRGEVSISSTPRDWHRRRHLLARIYNNPDCTTRKRTKNLGSSNYLAFTHRNRTTAAIRGQCGGHIDCQDVFTDTGHA